MVSFELGKEIKKDVFCLVANLGQRKSSESPRGIKPQNFGSCSLMLYHWATETLWWVKSITKRSIMKFLSRFLLGTENFFLCSTLQTRQKHLSLVRWKFKRGQLFAALHRFENSSNIDAAIQIFLHLPMSRFDSQSLYNICTVRRWSYVSRVFSHLHLITW